MAKHLFLETILIFFSFFLFGKEIRADRVACAEFCNNADSNQTGICKNSNPSLDGSYANCLDKGPDLCSTYSGINCYCCDLLPNPTMPQPDGNPKPWSLPFPYPCNQVAPNPLLTTTDEEFHSLRPYQASPCNTRLEDIALFCGNDIYVGRDESIIKNMDANLSTYTFNESEIQPHIPKDPFLEQMNPCWYCDTDAEGNPFCASNTYDDTCAPIAEQCWPGNEGACGKCEPGIDGSIGYEDCWFNVKGGGGVAIKMNASDFPIMGYTEPSKGNLDLSKPKVTNSYYTAEKPETIDNASKMNEYVSWYLNGVTGRAEYPFWDPVNDCVGASTNKVGSCLSTKINASNGEIQCMAEYPFPINFITEPYVVPWLKPDGKSTCTGKTQYCCLPWLRKDPEEKLTLNYSGPVKKLLPFGLQNIEKIDQIDDAQLSKKGLDKIRHDQVVACMYTFLDIDLFGIKVSPGAIPLPCYRNWKLDDFNSWQKIVAEIEMFLMDRKLLRLTDYYKNKPPIEEKYIGQDLDYFTVDYKRWRGMSCLQIRLPIPLINGFNFCFNVSLNQPAYFGSLFPYVPLSSTEDRLGQVNIIGGKTSSYSSKVKILSSRVISQGPISLFVPHMEEAVDLAELLQNTYAYKDANLDSIGSKPTLKKDPYCTYKQVRSNPGDDLFAGETSATIDYLAEVQCRFLTWGDPSGTDPLRPVGNLCRNLIEGGKCMPNNLRTYCEISYGQYDCAHGSLCCSGVTATLPTNPLCGPLGSGKVCVANNKLGTCGITADSECCDSNCLFLCALNPDASQCYYSETVPPLTQTCTNTVMASMKVQTKTPLADKVWAKLVAGSAGVFRKMFPKSGPGAPIEGISDIPAYTNAIYKNTGVGSLFAGSPASGTSGSNAKIYFPHIGGVKEYFLTGIQYMLRPYGFGSQKLISGTAEKQGVDAITSTFCSYSDSEITNAISKAATKYGIPESMLRGIYEIEGFIFIANPGSYECKRNTMDAMGLTQVIDETLNEVTCENELYDDDTGICTSNGTQLSRCDVDDAFELAARVLLLKVGLWDKTRCMALGSFPTAENITYRAICNYYGSCKPDTLTSQYSYNLPAGNCSNKNYCDIVFNKMGKGSCTYSYPCP